jgi:hypothetical protein
VWQIWWILGEANILSRRDEWLVGLTIWETDKSKRIPSEIFDLVVDGDDYIGSSQCMGRFQTSNRKKAQ